MNRKWVGLANRAFVCLLTSKPSSADDGHDCRNRLGSERRGEMCPFRRFPPDWRLRRPSPPS
jgi:hypothetical protein